MQRANLFLHCGANPSTREQVAAVFTPARTDTWVPISHRGTLICALTYPDTDGEQAHELTTPARTTT